MNMQGMQFLVFFTCLAVSLTLKSDTDVIKNLPGLTYNLNFKHYSGYLQASVGNNLHYWLVESQTSPEKDPLILWLNGGPGCSSLGGLLTELGPFRPNPDHTTLFENIYSWNKEANVLFLESPRDVGFSYRDNNATTDSIYNDRKTAWDNFLALQDFFDNYPNYKTRDFYVMGESYGGVYVPTLALLLIEQIQAGNLTAKLVGMAVGNGELSEYLQINSAVDLLYAHGIYGKREYDALKQCCPSTDQLYCDYSQYIVLQSDGTAVAKNFPNCSACSDCANLVVQMGFYRVWRTQNDVYNLYQDCYEPSGSGQSAQQSSPTSAASQDNGFIDQGSLINWASTDPFGAFPCYMNDAVENYLNQANVRAALHIPQSVSTLTYCNDSVNANYFQENHNMTSVFDHIIASRYNLRILVYNGDVDTVCNFLGDEWFIEALVDNYGMTTTAERNSWTFSSGSIAGYRKAFSYGNITIDLVTVKGAGHFVPTDRPGPALQMITNFIKNKDYSDPTNYSTERQPLLPQSTGSVPSAAFPLITILCVLLSIGPFNSSDVTKGS